ncbi:TetR/AcrR family transcriptional regulator [Bradyrhizobium japonicum]|uniref:TetR/AcrR family transcriptional regulator n=1 Tax=Bradyrhizobium japonicum TaxID=375 RepID=UPI00045688B9|nr:TetR/AcrR family transcriptional regulator [Bradyrhizobium japonicum]AHY51179.1 transcriptional regulatory protein [Bradyrhizobium japonicum SEMIA 5079]MCD9105029.1 TetR/AcrR family transcriptional regulator [Bradyrhizobium japonicum]MCD9255132.1 TetR/AcrR family transcriptional regulator [Bradyrhizobium japonicum SEMIA 5079]MCD9819908.1 TetR/AcrR family transcriptional regulator [Bradyrhizobium japonicum]MCD9892155.1 TetR/AcrR family transcriptional regulator [Bradyrhizobium japonicum]
MTNASSTSDDILACARTLIIAGGYNGFSYADVADVVGIRKPSIHHHFASKVDLVRTLVSRYRAEAEAGLTALERNVADPREQLKSYVGYWEACINDATAPFCVCALLACELPILPEEVALEVRAHFRSLASWLTSVMERGKRKGQLHLSGAAKIEAEGFMATIHGAMLSARAYGDPKMFGVITTPLLDRLSARH